MDLKTKSLARDPIPVDGITGILEAFKTYRLVALGEAHWLRQEADFITQLLKHPDFPRIVQIIEPDGTERLVRVPYIGRDGAPVTELRLRDMVDALLYLGPQLSLTFMPPATQRP